MSPHDHLQPAAPTEPLAGMHGPAPHAAIEHCERQAYTTGWHWGFICGALASGYIGALAVLCWASLA